MGYTHYWTMRHGAVYFTPAFLRDVRAVIRVAEKKYGVRVVREYDQQNKRPVVTENEIRLNGPGDDLGHETFLFEARPSGQRSGDLCKTERKPYDLVVTAILVLALEHFHGEISVRSDGDMAGEDWKPGAALAAEAVGRPIDVLFALARAGAA